MIELSGGYRLPYHYIPSRQGEVVSESNQPEISAPLLSRTARVALAVFTSIGKASVMTSRQLGTSFYRRVLGFDGARVHLDASLYGNAFKIVLWLLGTGMFFGISVAREFYKTVYPQTANPSSDLQSNYASKEINVNHLTMQDTAIDVSQVPPTVLVNDLMTIYDAINFTREGEPGYMTPSSLRGGGSHYTKEDLRESLNKFITYVNSRTAFLGTPPAYDTDKLESFYKQIEDAVRFSIHKVNEDLRVFIQENGQNVSAYTPENRKKYSGLLEDRSRIAIDLAIAGKACGARFMGESMDTYFLAKGDGAKSEGTLQDQLLSILADKRKEIANRQMALHLTRNGRLDTHDKTAYLQAVGKVIGLPGTANITEHLSSVDQSRYLGLFFREYTEDSIISTIEDEVKKEKNQFLRNSIADAVTDFLIGSLNEEDEREVQVNIQAMRDIRQDSLAAAGASSSSSSSSSSLRNHLKVFAELKAECSSYVFDEADWNGSVENFFIEKEVKDFFLKKMPGQGQAIMTQRRKFINDLTVSCKTYPDLFKRAGELSDEDKDKVFEIEKAGAVQKLFPGMGLASALRLLKTDALDVEIRDLKEKYRKQEFKGELLESMSKGLSQEIMEWLLVSQGILNAQETGGV